MCLCVLQSHQGQPHTHSYITTHRICATATETFPELEGNLLPAKQMTSEISAEFTESSHDGRNPPNGQILKFIGMEREGCQESEISSIVHTAVNFDSPNEGDSRTASTKAQIVGKRKLCFADSNDQIDKESSFNEGREDRLDDSQLEDNGRLSSILKRTCTMAPNDRWIRKLSIIEEKRTFCPSAARLFTEPLTSEQTAEESTKLCYFSLDELPYPWTPKALGLVPCSFPMRCCTHNDLQSPTQSQRRRGWPGYPAGSLTSFASSSRFSRDNNRFTIDRRNTISGSNGRRNEDRTRDGAEVQRTQSQDSNGAQSIGWNNESDGRRSSSNRLGSSSIVWSATNANECQSDRHGSDDLSVDYQSSLWDVDTLKGSGMWSRNISGSRNEQFPINQRHQATPSLTKFNSTEEDGEVFDEPEPFASATSSLSKQTSKEMRATAAVRRHIDRTV